jgi:hypothetical protein
MFQLHHHLLSPSLRIQLHPHLPSPKLRIQLNLILTLHLNQKLFLSQSLGLSLNQNLFLSQSPSLSLNRSRMPAILNPKPHQNPKLEPELQTLKDEPKGA